MKRAYGLLIMLALVGVFLTGCNRLWEPEADEARLATHWVSSPVAYDIWAGQHHNAGQVIVSLQDEDLIVRIVLADGWTMSESHVAVAASSQELPRNRAGHLVPGRFPYKARHRPAVTEFTYTIPVGDWAVGSSWAIAVHVVVARNGREETGWGGQWRGSFTYEVEKVDEVWKDVTIPEGWVRLRITENPWLAEQSYFKVELADIPPGDFDVWNGYWLGWCAEEDVLIQKDRWYDVRLWSTLNPLLPDRVKNDGWDNVNWLLNNKGDAANWVDLQLAIWYLLGRVEDPLSPAAASLAGEAIAQGSGYRPPPGGWIAVICETPENVQLVFIEVDP